MKHDVKKGRQRGIGIVEVIVALGLISIMFVGISTVARFSVRVQRTLSMQQRASLLAVEALEVTKFERDASWTTFSTKPYATNLYPEYVGMIAQLTLIDPGAIDGIYTRTIRLSRVYRDAMGNIAVMGTEDVRARHVLVTISWTDPFTSVRSTTLEAYILQI